MGRHEMDDRMQNSKQFTLSTRLIHLALASTIIVQLMTSLWMEKPKNGQEGNWFFEIHEYSGLLALGFAFTFWLVMILRRKGTPFGLLFPWLVAQRRLALWRDLKTHFHHILKRHLPDYSAESPLASAVHGLGLLLILLMSMTGGLYYLALNLALTKSVWAELVIETHEIFSTFVWVYLIAHSVLGILHHYLHNKSLANMLSIRP